MIYVLHDGARNAYKIGFTARSVRSRVRQMQTGRPDTLRILWSGDGSMDDERALHALLSPSRLRGEWFADTDVVRIAIDLLRWYGAPWTARLDLSMLRTYVPLSGSVPTFHRLREDWGPTGYVPQWTTRPCEL
jgi:hypothetical protein